MAPYMEGEIRISNEHGHAHRYVLRHRLLLRVAYGHVCWHAYGHGYRRMAQTLKIAAKNRPFQAVCAACKRVISSMCMPPRVVYATRASASSSRTMAAITYYLLYILLIICILYLCHQGFGFIKLENGGGRMDYIFCHRSDLIYSLGTAIADISYGPI